MFPTNSTFSPTTLTAGNYGDKPLPLWISILCVIGNVFGLVFIAICYRRWKQKKHLQSLRDESSIETSIRNSLTLETILKRPEAVDAFKIIKFLNTLYFIEKDEKRKETLNGRVVEIVFHIENIKRNYRKVDLENALEELSKVSYAFFYETQKEDILKVGDSKKLILSKLNENSDDESGSTSETGSYGASGSASAAVTMRNGQVDSQINEEMPRQSAAAKPEPAEARLDPPAIGGSSSARVLG